TEPPFYYLSDHLGSSSYITNSFGVITQTLGYLPYGEEWVDIDNTPPYLTPYKFSGKEKDEESGFSYFGSRYYWDKGGIWLSVDPMSHKYPHLTSYNYCANSPVMVIDPNGEEMDGFTVNNRGEFKKVDNTGGKLFDVIYNESAYKLGNREYDGTGNKNGIQVGKEFMANHTNKDFNIENIFGNKIGKGKNDRYVLKNQKQSESLLNFLDRNTDVEWSNANLKNKNGDKLNLLMTSHEKGRVSLNSTILDKYFPSNNFGLIKHDHNHPININGSDPSSGDIGFKNSQLSKSPNAIFRILYKGKYRTY
ncbi:MAG: RHS repeat-associated core domain-containing protein, partial [Bacteroidales bacterium]